MEEKKNEKNAPQVLPPYGYTPYCQPEEDEIDLRELWMTLKRRKRVVWSITLLFLVGAVIYLFVARPVYEASATIAIGKQLIKKSDGTLVTKYFDKATILKKMLDVKYDTSGKYRDKNTTSYISKITVPKKVDNFLIITAVGPNNEKAISMLKSPLQDVFFKHKIYLQSILDIDSHKVEDLSQQLTYYKTIELNRLKKELELVKNIDLKKINEKIYLIKEAKIPALLKKIEESKKTIEEKDHYIADLKREMSQTSQKDPALAAIASMQISRLQNDISRLSMKIIDYESDIKKFKNIDIPDLEKSKKRIIEEIIPAKKAAIKKMESMTIPNLESKIDELKVSMKPPYLVPTKTIGRIFTFDHPVKPKKKLILVVSLITGLILGVFLAFFLEFIQGIKEETPSIENKDQA